MAKNLQDLTLEELWHLFPIVLAPHNPGWKVWFENARQELLRIIPADSLAAIHHIGSTTQDLWHEEWSRHQQGRGNRPYSCGSRKRSHDLRQGTSDPRLPQTLQGSDAGGRLHRQGGAEDLVWRERWSPRCVCS